MLISVLVRSTSSSGRGGPSPVSEDGSTLCSDNGDGASSSSHVSNKQRKLFYLTLLRLTQVDPKRQH